jgi:DNA invertase Pin-like site-specific DNA recombinase
VAIYRVSTAEQGHSGLGLEAQQASVRAFVASQGWALVAEHQDIASGKDDRRPGFQAALIRCCQLGAVLVAARLDRITRRAHTLSQLLEDGVSIRTADMPGADDLMMRVYAAMAQKERELISERTRAALAAARARGAVLGGDRGWRPPSPPCAAAAATSRAERATRTAHRLALEVEALRAEGITTFQGLARALTERGVPAPRGGVVWTHTTVSRLVARTESSVREMTHLITCDNNEAGRRANRAVHSIAARSRAAERTAASVHNTASRHRVVGSMASCSAGDGVGDDIAPAR